MPEISRDNSLSFDRYSLEQGLSQSVANDLLQDSRGFLWIATQDGLNRFDGFTFKVFKNDPDDPYSIGDNFTFALWEDGQGNLWIGTGNGLNRYDPLSGRFERFAHAEDQPDSLAHNHIEHLVGDLEQRLWIGTVGGGLDRIDLAPLADKKNTSDADTQPALSFTHFRNDPSDPASLSEDTICALFVDQQGTLWIGTQRGLNRLDRDSDSFTRYYHDPDNPFSLSDDHVTAIAQDAYGYLWIGTNSAGLNRFDQKTGRFTRFRHSIADTGSLSYNQIEALFFDLGGNLWIGTGGGGVDYLSKSEQSPQADSGRGARFVHFRSDPLDLRSISNDQVWSILQDRSGVLWFGTFGSGIARLDPAKARFRDYHADPNDSSSLSSSFIWGLIEDRAGNVWIGTGDGGLNRWDRITDTFTSFRHDPLVENSLSNDQVWYVYEDRQGILWLGTDSGLDRFDPQAHIFKHYPMATPWAIIEDSSGYIWLGTFGTGLGRLDPESETVTWFPHDPNDPNSLSDNSIIHLRQDAEGKLWVSTLFGGLNRFDPSSLEFERFSHDPANPSSLGHVTVLCTFEDSQGRMWVCTYGGLDLYDPATDTFRHFREKDGLPNNLIYGILEDSRGDLWMSTNHGISRFDPQSLTFTNFDQRDGLQSNEFNQNAYLKTRDGLFIFGGLNGFNAFYPTEITSSTYKPAVFITDFQLFNQSIQPGKDPALSQTIESTRQIVLPYTQNYLAFEFAALDYAAPEKIQFAYILEGLDKDWNQSGTRRFASYPNLPPGSYTLRVKATNRDGIWNDQAAELDILITPPFWRTWWFGLLLFITVSGSLAGAVALRIRAIQAQQRQLENLVEERTSALTRALEELKRSKEAAETANRAKSAFLANISHELRTPLNAILGFSQLMLRQSDTTPEQPLAPEQRRNLQVINRSGEHLLGLINDVLEMSKIEAGRLTLNLQSFNLFYMLDGLEDMFRLRAESKGLQLVFERGEGLAQYLYGDEGKLRQILLNLLGNAVKFTTQGGIYVRTSMAPLSPDARPGSDNLDPQPSSTLIVEVQDTGPGIAEDDLQKIFEPFVQAANVLQTPEGTGLGLSISQQYARLMGGDISVSSLPGKGSTFTLAVPIRLVDLQAVQHPTARKVYGVQSGQPEYRILVVDDKEVNRSLLTGILRPLGFSVEEAVDGEQAIEVWEQWQPQLILMDIRMPVIDGYEATRRIKATPRGQVTVIIALTASALEEERSAILASGCDDYIRKPFRENDLLDAITNHLGVKLNYGDETLLQAVSQQPSIPPADLLARLAAIPAAALSDLRHAARMGYWNQLQDCIHTIAQSDPVLGQLLAHLATSYDQDQILALLEDQVEPDSPKN